jgi:hypothetical protein
MRNQEQLFRVFPDGITNESMRSPSTPSFVLVEGARTALLEWCHTNFTQSKRKANTTLMKTAENVWTQLSASFSSDERYLVIAPVGLPKKRRFRFNPAQRPMAARGP